MNFPVDLTDMILIQGECIKNCLLAQRIYQGRYPAHRQPQKVTLETLVDRSLKSTA